MRPQSLFRTSAALLVGATLLCSSSAIATPDQARAYLENAAYDELPDYVFSGRPLTGSIAGGQYTHRTVRLRAGVEYIFMAACDDYCTDVDLYLYDRYGQTLLDSDSDTDDYPIISFTPSNTGNYRLSIQMYTCSNSTCGYAIGTLTR
ncbi:hypothetical protein [Thermocoleostomius sinensis]|uniref:Peptidase C-terminal archaeal/bacterial domain-containing protein n=1 Tax=Thermocoleostomius sinensis A174 TaxID=2016057 RepID=A0A9E8ZDU3_9CYAN|nr:hypothetical protein [Thermocoleostomius sinensis]WAL61494.1 hypothetical protein OXH18_05760 [Thermocoleostomius sinensis A174]